MSDCAIEDHDRICKELRQLLPPLSEKQMAKLLCGGLGLEGFNQDYTRYAMLLPTPGSPLYWLWTVQDLQLQIKENSISGMMSHKIPWDRFAGITFSPVAMEHGWHHPSPWAPMRRYGITKHLYVIQGRLGGPVRFGKAANPIIRAEQLQLENAQPLNVIRIYGNQGKQEERVREAISRYRLYGEWFDECVIEIIDQLLQQGGQHDRA